MVSYIHSRGAVTLNTAVSMFNGLDDPGTPAIEAANGITIYSQNPASKTTVTNSVAIGNGGYGIFLHKNGGSYLLTNTIYFGNNVSGVFRNLLIVDGI